MWSTSSDPDAVTRPIGGDQDDEWAEGRRYLGTLTRAVAAEIADRSDS